MCTHTHHFSTPAPTHPDDISPSHATTLRLNKMAAEIGASEVQRLHFFFSLSSFILPSSLVSALDIPFQSDGGMEECDEIRTWSEAHSRLVTIYRMEPITLAEHLIRARCSPFITSECMHKGIWSFFFCHASLSSHTFVVFSTSACLNKSLCLFVCLAYICIYVIY